MFFTRYSNIGIGQKYRYYIGRYRYQQKWPISADTDTDIGSTLVMTYDVRYTLSTQGPFRYVK